MTNKCDKPYYLHYEDYKANCDDKTNFSMGCKITSDICSICGEKMCGHFVPNNNYLQPTTFTDFSPSSYEYVGPADTAWKDVCNIGDL